jgi:UDP-3-O-[3-hydroxymyristoyl] glucosamine N-acyltransferase
VIGNVPSGSVYSGHPARPNRQVLRAQAALYRLAPIVGELESLLAERRGDA